MAGAVLPPETLAQMAIVQSEEAYYTRTSSEQDDSSGRVVIKSNGDLLDEYMQTILPKECPSQSYKDAPQWFQSRTSLPQITLDQVLIQYDPATKECQCQLTCALPRNILWNIDATTGTTTTTQADELAAAATHGKKSSFVVSVTPELVEPFAFNYNPETSHIFTALALALRYKAPIVLQVKQDDVQDEVDVDNDNIDSYYYPPELLEQDFPQRTSVQKLHQQTSRISQNIETGFKVNQLTGALQIAKRLGDTKAIEKIQAKLAEYDNMDDLPVVGEDDNNDKTGSSSSTMKNDKDDNENDIKNGNDDDNNLTSMVREESGIIAEDSDSNAFQ
mmetsp:Transcript_35034/g.84820  ORF Transcript_35034/g.84820 Transcript_35034/m.84820 type:complete len:333 (+) Transcript_35034:342-1340(+)